MAMYAMAPLQASAFPAELAAWKCVGDGTASWHASAYPLAPNRKQERHALQHAIAQNLHLDDLCRY